MVRVGNIPASHRAWPRGVQGIFLRVIWLCFMRFQLRTHIRGPKSRINEPRPSLTSATICHRIPLRDAQLTSWN